MAENKPFELSIRAYAKHKGVTDTAVRKAIKNGRITIKKNGKIDKEKADADWETYKQIEKERDMPLVQESMGSDSRNIYRQSKTVEATYKAKNEKLKYEKEIGKLIDANQVRIEAFNMARKTRDRVLNVPDRVIPMLIGKTDIKEMKKILRKELIVALKELGDNKDGASN